MKVLTVGIHKVDLLLNLYNNANFQGTAFNDNPVMKKVGAISATLKGDRTKAEQLIRSGQKNFDYVDLGVGLRPLKISFDGFEIETASYDEYHGEGLGSRIVESMRAELITLTSGAQYGSLGFLLGSISKNIQKAKDENTCSMLESDAPQAPGNIASSSNCQAINEPIPPTIKPTKKLKIS